jgi:hypothetical protein
LDQPQNKHPSNQVPDDKASGIEIGFVEHEFFVFSTFNIQGFFWSPEIDDQEPTTTIFLEGWVSPVTRTDPDKKLYYFLLKKTKPEKLNL